MGIHLVYFVRLSSEEETVLTNKIKKLVDTYKISTKTARKIIKSEESVNYVKGNWYTTICFSSDLFYKPFPLYNTKFFSLESILQYLENNPKCKMIEEGEKILKDFWDKYPNGFITFI